MTATFIWREAAVDLALPDALPGLDDKAAWHLERGQPAILVCETARRSSDERRHCLARLRVGAQPVFSARRARVPGRGRGNADAKQPLHPRRNVPR